MSPNRAILCGDFGSMSIDTDTLPTMQEIAEQADPKLRAELIRRGWIPNPELDLFSGANRVYHPAVQPSPRELAGPSAAGQLEGDSPPLTD